jgi:hypothetical protein
VRRGTRLLISAVTPNGKTRNVLCGDRPAARRSRADARRSATEMNRSKPDWRLISVADLLALPAASRPAPVTAVYSSLAMRSAERRSFLVVL